MAESYANYFKDKSSGILLLRFWLNDLDIEPENAQQKIKYHFMQKARNAND